MPRLPSAPVTSLGAVTKTPKGYVVDSGLAAALGGYLSPGSLDETFMGHLLESAVFMALQVVSELWMMSEDSQCVGGVVIYGGTDVRLLADHVIAVPWSML